MSTTTVIEPKKWNLEQRNWKAQRKYFKKASAKQGFAYILLADETNTHAPTAESHRSREAAAYKIATDKLSAYTMLEASLSPTNWSELAPTDEAEAALEGDPVKLFKLLEDYAKGAADVMSAAENMSNFTSATWAEIADTGQSLTLEEQASATMTKLLDHVNISTLIGGALQVTVDFACHRFVELMPVQLKVGNSAALTEITDPTKLVRLSKQIIKNLKGRQGSELSVLAMFNPSTPEAPANDYTTDDVLADRLDRLEQMVEDLASALL